MSKYRVCVPYHASVWVEVEAETEDQAKTKGVEDAWPSLCHQCSGDVELHEFNDVSEPSVYLIED